MAGAETAPLPLSGRVPGIALAIASMTTIQLGAALSEPMFDEIGAAGTVALRLALAALMLWPFVRPRLRGRTREDLGAAVALAGSRRLRDVGWVLTAGAGVALLTVGDGAGEPLDPAGVGFALVSAVCWAGYILLTKRVGARWAGLAGLSAALDAVLGARRARILAELGAPASTTELAARLGASAAGVSEHLAVLRRAGLVTSAREGRAVRYVRTEAGDALLRAPSGLDTMEVSANFKPMCHARRHHQHAARRPATQQDPGLRASDAEREVTVGALREHAAAGRLDVEELEQRIDAAYGARTHGELAALQRDLPQTGRPPRSPAVRAHAHDWTVFLQVNALLVAIWAIGGAGYFWPAWVIAWWGLALVLKTAPGVLRLR